MSTRLALEPWQLLLPAIGLGIFAAVFFGVVIWVCRMKRPAVDHLENLPLELDEKPSPVAGRGEAGPGSPTSTSSGQAPPATINPARAANHVR